MYILHLALKMACFVRKSVLEKCHVYVGLLYLRIFVVLYEFKVNANSFRPSKETNRGIARCSTIAEVYRAMFCVSLNLVMLQPTL